MFRNWTLGRKLATGFAAAGLTLSIIAAFGYRNTEYLIETTSRVSHTHAVRSSIARLIAELIEAESGERGFVITGEERFLESYTDALGQIDKTYDELRAQTSDNPVQLRRLDNARLLIDDRLAEFKQVIQTRRTSGFQPSADRVAKGHGKETTSRLRKISADMDATERELLERRLREANASATSTKGMIVWGSMVGVALVLVIGLYIARSASNQVGTAVSRMQSSSAELHAAANQQVTGAKEQSTAMSEVTTTMSELLATSRQIAESAQRVAQIAEQATASANAGEETVGRGHDAIASIRRQVDLIVSNMLELGKKSQQIGSVLDIVSELAEQTNILAINATIEAAGAGEAGKRFAVVADEIRKLADRVTIATKDIRVLIDEVRSAVNTTVMTTEGGSKTVDSGTRQFGEVATAFKQIVGLIATTSEAAREIELSTKQQSTAVEQINIAIANVAQATRETEASSGQTLQTAAEIDGLSRALLRLVENESTA